MEKYQLHWIVGISEGKIKNMMYAMWDWLVKGGPVMIPIVGFSIVVCALIVERFVYFHKIQHNTEEFIEKITELLEQGKINEAQQLCESVSSPLARILNTGIFTLQKNPQLIRERIHEVVLDEMPKLEKYLSLISTIATIEPMLGLLGTVTGMIRCFTVIALKGTGDPQSLAGGISEALITTEAGLIVAIPILYLHNVLSDKVEHIVSSMEKGTARFIAMTEDGRRETVGGRR
ncbi:MAG: MotA/TolQ/ExbB proton channel family protein [Elusimicrobiota bacterium]